MHNLQIQLFGPPEVCVEGVPISTLRTRKGLWLLCLLAMREGREVERSWLAGVLWPDSLQEAALGNLRRALTDLRQALGESAACLEGPTSTRLRLSGCDCDLSQFRRLSSSNSIDEWTKAAELGRGTLLEGCDEEWVPEERQAHESAWLTLVERLADHLSASGKHREAADWYSALLARDPYRETALRHQMECLAACGSYSAALEAFRLMRDRLWESMRVAPAAETTKLYQALRQTARSDDQQRAGTASVLCPLETTAAHQTVPTDTSRNRPPAPLTGLIGRSGEMAELLSSVWEHRAVTLFGSGGVGKTRLAQEAARNLEGEFEDGVVWVELAQISDGGRIAQIVAEALGIRMEQGRDIMDTLKDHLRARHALLVLDNCEHVITDASLFVRDLLRGTEAPHVMCTSRQFLEFAGEHVMRLLPFRVQEGMDAVAVQAADMPAVQLFVERAMARDPGFCLSTTNVLPVLQICQRLDGIPLAIELAAARVNLLPVQQILARLDDRFRLLSGGQQSPTPHHRTLRSLVSWSYDLLHPDMAALFRRLSIFPGGCTLQAVVETCGDPNEDELDLMERLQGLVQRALIQPIDTEGERRYMMLETLRAFSREKLAESGELPLMEERLLVWADGFAKRAKEMLDSLAVPNALSLVGSDMENVRAALNGTGNACLRLQIATALLRYWEFRGNFSEGREHIERALQLARASGADGRLMSNGTRVAGNLARMHGDVAQAKRWLNQSVDAAIEVGDLSLEAKARNTLGVTLMDAGENLAAKEQYIAAHSLSKEVGDTECLLQTMSNLGIISLKLGQLDDAEAAQRMVIGLYEQQNDLRGMCIACLNLGVALQNKGELEACLAATQIGIDLGRKYHFVRDLRMLLTNIAEVYLALEQFDLAHKNAQEAVELARNIVYPFGLADALLILARVEFRTGNVEAARTSLKEVYELLMGKGDIVRNCNFLDDVASWAAIMRQWTQCAVIMAAVDGLRTGCDTPRMPSDEPLWNSLTEQTSGAITSEEICLAKAKGRAMTETEAMTYAWAVLNGSV